MGSRELITINDGPTVDIDCLAGNATRLFGGEHDRDRGDFLGLDETILRRKLLQPIAVRPLGQRVRSKTSQFSEDENGSLP